MRRVTEHFTKEPASRAKMRRSAKVIATHRVSCDIFISEVKNTRSPRSALCVRAPPSGLQLKSPTAALLCVCVCVTVLCALQDLGLATVWDDHLSYLLSSALSAYELERCSGVSCGNEEFQDAVRRAVPDGHTFKGFPIHFLHCNARRAFATCLK